MRKSLAGSLAGVFCWVAWNAGPAGAGGSCNPPARRTLSPCFKAAGPRVKVAFFDADSTLRVSRSGSPSANTPTDVLVLPMVARRLKELAEEGWLIAVASNQAGVESGYITFEIADSALRYTLRQLRLRRGIVHWYDFAEARDGFRKPEAGMARELAKALAAQGLEIDWKASMMVGDSAWKRGHDKEPDGRPGEDVGDADRLFAETVRRELAGGEGFAFHHPRDFFGWSRLGVRNFHGAKDLEAFKKAHPDVR